MNSSSSRFTGFIFFLYFQAASGFAAAPYWLAGSTSVVPDEATPSVVLPNARAKNPATAAWIKQWADPPATERWNDEALRLIAKYRLNPLRSARALTYLHVVMDDARLRAEKLGMKPVPQSAAVHVAASAMLMHFFPLESTGRVEAMGESALAALTANTPNQAREIARGASVGRGIARQAMLRALNDGADAVWDPRTRPDNKTGLWRGTPPLESAHPQEPLAGTWQTWALENGGEIQPHAPPAPDSDAFLQAASEVLEVSRNLTPEQKRIAEVWHLDQGTVTPPGLWNQKARELAKRRKLPEKERLRLLSALNVAMFDASIACWRAKYTGWVQRPVTAIHERMDKTFTPWLVTPSHPSYVSAHATVSGAAAEIMKRAFPKDARQIDDSANEAALSRLYGGIHYRFDNEAGLALGRQVGKAVLARTPGK